MDKQKIVTVPFAGYFEVTIDGDDSNGTDNELIAQAFERLGDARVEANSPDVEVGGWECLRHIVQGNVFYGPCAEVSVSDA